MTCARFLITWHAEPQPDDASDTGCKCLLSGFMEVGRTDRLAIQVGPGTPVLELPGGRGWLIGRLFSKDDEARTIVSLSPREAEMILTSQGRALITDFWGSYLAVLCPREGELPLLLRDASGFMPCYILPSDRGAHYASDVAVLVEAGLLSASVDWSVLYAHLLTPELRRRNTCLTGLSELSQGHVMTADARGPQSMIWSPCDHLEPIDGDSAALAAKLEATILSSTAALARAYGPILVGASGGLDSSIVCAALAAAGHPFACFTIATTDPSGDERRYVREIASAYEVDSLEYVYQPKGVDPTQSAAQHLPRPVGRFFMQQIESRYRDAQMKAGAEAILTGNGGDNVFCFLHSASPVVDRLLSEGLRISTWSTMISMCRITGCDLGTMFGGIVRGIWRRRVPYQWSPDPRFLSADGLGRIMPPVLTPWLEVSQDLLPGKRAHVAALMRIQHVIEGYERASSIPVIPSLLAQPVVELCLSIPTWRWCEGGINRSMARQAFAARLPQSIARRTAKAGPESLSAELFERWLPVLREQLLDGLLSQHGVLDRQAVEQALARTATRRGQVFHRLLALAEAEAWSRRWHGSRAG